MLFPSNLLERIPSNHPVFIVNQIVDRLNIDSLLSKYKGGGSSAYHPRMLLKVLFYAYLINIYSCRKIARALQENIYFMWLSGNSTPDFRTINRFWGESLFTQIVLLLQESGYVSLDVQYIDGTKIESAFNKYTFVGRGSVEKYKSKLEDIIRCVFSLVDEYIEQDKQEEKVPEIPTPIDSDLLRDKVKDLNSRLDRMNKMERKQVQALQDDYLPRLEKYESQLEKLGERNTYSKTDEYATFMRMKEDHMKNVQLKPAYNVRISTEEQFITTGIYQRSGDTATLPSFFEDFEKNCHKQPPTVVTDAGYGSEQNCEIMEDNEIEAYVKYSYFHKEQKRAWKKKPFAVQNLFYNKDNDFFTCPMGQKLTSIGTRKNKSELGYIATPTRYQAQNCEGCPLRNLCHQSKGNRRIEINCKPGEYKRKARKCLTSEQGLY